MLDTIVTGGQVVTPNGVAEVDVAISDGRIAALAHPGVLSSEGAQVVDATGMIVLPGGIEPHTHIGIPVPEQWAGRLRCSLSLPRRRRGLRLSAASRRFSTSLGLCLSLLTTPYRRTRSCDRWRRGVRRSTDTATSTSRTTTSWQARLVLRQLARSERRSRRASPASRSSRRSEGACPTATCRPSSRRSRRAAVSWRSTLRTTTW